MSDASFATSVPAIPWQEEEEGDDQILVYDFRRTLMGHKLKWHIFMIFLLFFLEVNVTASVSSEGKSCCSQQYYSSVPAEQYDMYKWEERETPAAQLHSGNSPNLLEKNWLEVLFNPVLWKPVISVLKDNASKVYFKL